MRSPLRRNSLARIRGNVFRSGARLQWWPRPKWPPTAAAGPTASGSITLGGTATAVASAPSTTGTITLGGSGTGAASPAATGSITLGGSATATAPASASGSITLGGTPSGVALLAPAVPDLRANALGNNGQITASSTTPIVIPAGAATDGTDYAVVAVSAESGSVPTVTSAPAGWTLLSGPNSTSGHRSYLYGKTIAPGDPGTTVTWTWSSSAFVPGHMAVYKNVTATGMLVGTPNVDGSNGTTIDIPSLGSVPAGALVHVHFALRSSVGGAAPDVTTPAGYSAGTSPRSGSDTASVEHAYQITSAAGTYGGETATIDKSSQGVVYIVALPAAVPVAGSITLGGTATATVAAASTGSITLGGTSTPSTTATGSISLGGAPAATAAATTTGTVTLSGTATGTPPSGSTATGTIVLGGTPTAAVPATTAGLITLSGLAAAESLTVLSHIPGVATLSRAEATAILTGNGAGTATLAYQAGTAVLTANAGTAVLTYQPGTADLSPAAALALVNTT